MEADPAIPTALAAGLVSFASPCVLPLVPGYLSAVTGVAPDDLEQAGWRRVLLPSLLFVGSFSTIFILLGLSASKIGGFFNDNLELLRRISAALIIAMGVFLIAAMFINRLNREWHIDSLMARAGTGGPVVVGAAFAIAWTPCAGPTLGAILTAAANSSSPGHGAFLLAVYSAGLAIPFLLTAVAFGRMTTAFDLVKRHYSAIMAVGGLILIGMGVLLWSNQLNPLNGDVQTWLREHGLDFYNF